MSRKSWCDLQESESEKRRRRREEERGRTWVNSVPSKETMSTPPISDPPVAIKMWSELKVQDSSLIS
jgi:hypothetical protein